MANQSAVLLSNLRKDLVEALPDLDMIPEDPAHCLDAQASAVASLVKDIVRKEVPPKDAKAELLRLRDAAVATFHWANNRCETAAIKPPTPYVHRVMNEVRAILSRLPEISFAHVFPYARVAGGASIGSNGLNSELEKLFLNGITSYSVDTVRQYLTLIGDYPTYKRAEVQRQVMVGTRTAFTIVDGSTFSTVRKTFKTDRGICTEASLDMFFQLGVGEIINDFLRDEFGYCPKRQPDRNRRAVLRGSVDGTTASIDSTSASDLWATTVVKSLLCYRLDWFEMLSQLRADRTSMPGKAGAVELHMISSMGNGFTFPLETLLFAAVVKAVAIVEGVALTRFSDKHANFGVFGDDIICPAIIAEKLMYVLAELGHVPNLEKSYVAGPFRESCGVDAFRGVDVRAVFHKHWTRQGRYATINALNMWSARWGIPLRRTVRFLLPSGWKEHVIPMTSDPSEGIYSPTQRLASLYTSWAAAQNVEQIYFVRVQVEEDGKQRYHMLRERFKNPFGVLLCHVAGSIRGGVITRRAPPDVCDDHLRSAVTSPHKAHVWVCEQELRVADVSFAMWTTLAGYNLQL